MLRANRVREPKHGTSAPDNSLEHTRKGRVRARQNPRKDQGRAECKPFDFAVSPRTLRRLAICCPTSRAAQADNYLKLTRRAVP